MISKMGFLRSCVCGISTGLLWDFYGMSMEVLWSFLKKKHEVSMEFPCISMVFQWDFFEVPMGFP